LSAALLDYLALIGVIVAAPAAIIGVVTANSPRLRELMPGGAGRAFFAGLVLCYSMIFPGIAIVIAFNAQLQEIGRLEPLLDYLARPLVMGLVAGLVTWSFQRFSKRGSLIGDYYAARNAVRLERV
jgi:hypothetical protein